MECVTAGETFGKGIVVNRCHIFLLYCSLSNIDQFLCMRDSASVFGLIIAGVFYSSPYIRKPFSRLSVACLLLLYDSTNIELYNRSYRGVNPQTPKRK